MGRSLVARPLLMQLCLTLAAALLLCLASGAPTPMPFAPVCSRTTDPNTARCFAQVLTNQAATEGPDALKKLFRPDIAAVVPGAAKFNHVALEEPVNQNATNTTGGRRMLRGLGGGRAISGLPSGYSPAQLQQAYTASARPTSCLPIAIVDAFSNPHAQSDLNTYRSTFNLGAMTIQQVRREVGGCLVDAGA